MEESDFSNYSQSIERDYNHHENRLSDSYNKVSDHNTSVHYEKGGLEYEDGSNKYENSQKQSTMSLDKNKTDVNDGPDIWNKEEHYKPSIDEDENSKDDSSMVLLDIDTTDTAIGSDKYFTANLTGDDKQNENSNENQQLRNQQSQPPQLQETTCAQDCMYYTLLCCECSIL